jgi:hypothetical protein
MNDTCNYEKCGFAKKCKFRTADECPNYVVSVFTNSKSGESRQVSDCAPKRNLILTQNIYNRLEGIQQASEQTRNAVAPVAELIGNAAKIKKLGAADV